MSGLVIDTHIIVWYLVHPGNLSRLAREAILQTESSGDPIFISAITLVEMQYLVEKGRLAQGVLQGTTDALDDAVSPLVLHPLDRGVAQTLALIARDDVPDMPDRIIAATALHLGLPLVTRDHRIRASSITTIW